MEKRDEVNLLVKHWGCTDKNIYALMKKPSYSKKISIMTMGSLCIENDISEKELLNIIEFLKKQKAINVG